MSKFRSWSRRRSRHTSRGDASQRRGTRTNSSSAGWPSTRSAIRPSTTQPRNAFGSAFRSAHSTGTPWITSPMALRRTIKILGDGRFKGSVIYRLAAEHGYDAGELGLGARNCSRSAVRVDAGFSQQTQRFFAWQSGGPCGPEPARPGTSMTADSYAARVSCVNRWSVKSRCPRSNARDRIWSSRGRSDTICSSFSARSSTSSGRQRGQSRRRRPAPECRQKPRPPAADRRPASRRPTGCRVRDSRDTAARDDTVGADRASRDETRGSGCASAQSAAETRSEVVGIRIVDQRIAIDVQLNIGPGLRRE